MHLACRAERVLLDASPIRRFLEVDLTLLDLARYLQHALITPHVFSELDHVAGWRHNAALKLVFALKPPWPTQTGPPSDELEDEISRIRNEIAEPGDPQTKHLGEVATIVMARHLGIPLVVVDDDAGKKLARASDPPLPRISTAMLAAEMVIRAALDDDLGFRVYDLATPDGVGLPEWLAAKKRVQTELAR